MTTTTNLAGLQGYLAVARGSQGARFQPSKYMDYSLTSRPRGNRTCGAEPGGVVA